MQLKSDVGMGNKIGVFLGALLTIVIPDTISTVFAGAAFMFVFCIKGVVGGAMGVVGTKFMQWVFKKRK